MGTIKESLKVEEIKVIEKYTIGVNTPESSTHPFSQYNVTQKSTMANISDDELPEDEKGKNPWPYDIYAKNFSNHINPQSIYAKIQFRVGNKNVGSAQNPQYVPNWVDLNAHRANTYFKSLDIEDNGGIQKLSMELYDKDFTNLEYLIRTAVASSQLLLGVESVVSEQSSITELEEQRDAELQRAAERAASVARTNFQNNFGWLIGNDDVNTLDNNKVYKKIFETFPIKNYLTKLLEQKKVIQKSNLGDNNVTTVDFQNNEDVSNKKKIEIFKNHLQILAKTIENENVSNHEQRSQQLRNNSQGGFLNLDSEQIESYRNFFASFAEQFSGSFKKFIQKVAYSTALGSTTKNITDLKEFLEKYFTIGNDQSTQHGIYNEITGLFNNGRDFKNLINNITTNIYNATNNILNGSKIEYCLNKDGWFSGYGDIEKKWEKFQNSISTFNDIKNFINPKINIKNDNKWFTWILDPSEKYGEIKENVIFNINVGFDDRHETLIEHIANVLSVFFDIKLISSQELKTTAGHFIQSYNPSTGEFTTSNIPNGKYYISLGSYYSLYNPDTNIDIIGDEGNGSGTDAFNNKLFAMLYLCLNQYRTHFKNGIDVSKSLWAVKIKELEELFNTNIGFNNESITSSYATSFLSYPANMSESEINNAKSNITSNSQSYINNNITPPNNQALAVYTIDRCLSVNGTNGLNLNRSFLITLEERQTRYSNEERKYYFVNNSNILVKKLTDISEKVTEALDFLQTLEANKVAEALKTENSQLSSTIQNIQRNLMMQETKDLRLQQIANELASNLRIVIGYADLNSIFEEQDANGEGERRQSDVNGNTYNRGTTGYLWNTWLGTQGANARWNELSHHNASDNSLSNDLKWDSIILKKNQNVIRSAPFEYFINNVKAKITRQGLYYSIEAFSMTSEIINKFKIVQKYAALRGTPGSLLASLLKSFNENMSPVEGTNVNQNRQGKETMMYLAWGEVDFPMDKLPACYEIKTEGDTTGASLEEVKIVLPLGGEESLTSTKKLYKPIASLLNDFCAKFPMLVLVKNTPIMNLGLDKVYGINTSGEPINNKGTVLSIVKEGDRYKAIEASENSIATRTAEGNYEDMVINTEIKKYPLTWAVQRLPTSNEAKDKIIIWFYYKKPRKYRYIRNYDWGLIDNNVVKTLEIENKNEFASMSSFTIYHPQTRGIKRGEAGLKAKTESALASINSINSYGITSATTYSIPEGEDPKTSIPTVFVNKVYNPSGGSEQEINYYNTIQSMYANSVFQGQITVVGDPGLFTSTNICPYMYPIKINMYTPSYIEEKTANGEPTGIFREGTERNYMSGVYVVTGFKHSISTSGNTTTIGVMRYPGLEDELAHLDAQGKPAARTEDVNGLGSLFRKRQEDFLKANSDEIASPTSAEEIKKMEEEMDLVAEAAAKFAEPYSYTLNVSPSLIIADPGEGNNTLTEPYSTTLAITVSKNSSTKLINDKNVKLKIQGVDNANLRITEGSSATKVNDDMNTWQANITIPKDVERGKTSLLRVYLDRRENEPEIYYNVSVGVKANTTRPPYTILSTELENTKIIEFIKRYEGDKVDFYIPGSFSPNNGVYQYYGEPLATNVSFEPRESSGVTIGMGIDLGQREISVVKNLFLSAGFDNTLADKYSQFGNKKGQSAVSILYTINSGMPGQKVTITANQKDVLNNTIYLNMTGTMYTRYTNYITNKTLEWVGLPTNAKIALISFYWQFGQSLTAHPNVINNIAQEKWKEAAAAIKGANSETRRIAEANLLLEIIGETPYPYP